MKRFSLSPSLSAQSVFFSSFSSFTSQPRTHSRGPEIFIPAGPFPRLLAQPAQRPLPLPDSPPGGPRLSGASSSPTEPDSGSSPTRPRARRRVPLGPARPGPCSAPIKGTLDPLETPNRSRSRRFRKNLARAAAIVEASRSFAAPPFRFDFSTTSLLRSSAVVRGTSPTFYLPSFCSVSPVLARRRRRSAMRRRTAAPLAYVPHKPRHRVRVLARVLPVQEPSQ